MKTVLSKIAPLLAGAFAVLSGVWATSAAEQRKNDKIEALERHVHSLQEDIREIRLHVTNKEDNQCP